MSGPIWSRSMVERRRAALLVRIGAAGPAGISVASLAWDGSDDERKDAAHLAQRHPALLNDPVRVRMLQQVTLRNDLQLLRRLGAVEVVPQGAERIPGDPELGLVAAWRLAGSR